MDRKRKHDLNIIRKSKRARTKTDRHGKRESTHNFNEYFSGSSAPIARRQEPDEQFTKEELNCFKLDTPTYDELLSLIQTMNSTIHFLSSTVSNLSMEMRRIKSTTSLELSCSEVKEVEKSCVDQMKNFELPISSKTILDALDTALANDSSFRSFFIRRSVPIVRNMYQNHKQILWGFMTSLVHNKLLSQYTWSGRSEHGTKFGFKSLKQIQTILFAAMVQIDKQYSIIQFENDMKANLTKCSNQFHKTQTMVNSSEISKESNENIDLVSPSTEPSIMMTKCDEIADTTISTIEKPVEKLSCEEEITASV